MNQVKRPVITMNCRNRQLAFGEKTLIMGILNVTPDSFSDGGDFTDVDRAVAHALAMIEEGADVIDLGGESSRPGHVQITAEEELGRILPVIDRLTAETGTILSLDTIRSEVAEQALQHGIHMINDIWGLQGDPAMAQVCARYQAPVVIMHNQDGTDYDDLMADMVRFFKKSLAIAHEAGIPDDQIILDPGIGFGKTPEQNVYVMGHLEPIIELGYPVLLATSRKSTLGKILDLPPKERMEGTLATTVLGIAQGADMVRVHDVKENLRAAKVTDAIIRGNWHG